MNRVYNPRENAEFLHRISNSVNPSRSNITLENLVVLPNIRKEYNFSYDDDKYELKYSESKNKVSLYYGKKNSSIIDIVSKLKTHKRQPSNKLFPIIRNNSNYNISS